MFSLFLPSLRLWSIGVGSVIGGDFFGWNSTLHGGFGASLVALSINAIMFGILAHCTTKLSARVPKGGAYKFVEIGIGPKTSLFVAGLELVKLFWVLSALCFGLTDYLRLLFGFSSQFQFLCYPLLFSIFSLLGMLGIKTSGNIQIVITCGCLFVLSFYWISMSTIFNFNANAIPDHSWFNSWRSTLISIPYGSWLFLGFEELPLIQIEEDKPHDHSSSSLVAHILPLHSSPSPSNISNTSSTPSPHKPSSNSHHSKVMLHGILSSFLTVFISGALTVTLASASRPGVNHLKDKTSPLLSGIEEVYGDDSPIAILFNILSVLALFAPCYSFMLYCSEHIQVWSRSSYLFLHILRKLRQLRFFQSTILHPTSHSLTSHLTHCSSFLSEVNARRIPVTALWSVALLGWIIMSLFGLLFGLNTSSSVMIPGCIAPALISYFFQLQSLINIQTKEANQMQRETVAVDGSSQVIRRSFPPPLHALAYLALHLTCRER
jgi:hypothetical protein